MKLKDVVAKVPTVLVLASSLLLNVVLTARVYRQMDIIHGLTPLPPLKIGTVVGRFTGRDLSGGAITVNPAEGKGTLLYVFAPECGWCERNGANMQVVIRSARERGIAVYGVSLVDRGTPEFLNKHGLTIQTILPSDEFRKDYLLGGTPQTILIDSGGRVVKNWRGAYTGKVADDVSAYFDVRLPGWPDEKSATQ